MKPTIDQQIEAVEWLAVSSIDPRLHAALTTLRWVKRHAPTIKSVLGEFEGAKVVPKIDEV